MRKYTKFLAGILAGALVAAGLAVLAQTSNLTNYVGYNPVTNVNGVLGIPVSTGTLPTLGASTSCGTTATVQASMVGGSGVFQLTAGATTCTIQIVYPAAAAAPNGYYCVAFDETTRAGAFSQTAHTTTGCTVASGSGTVVSSDKILIEVNGF